MEEIAKAEDGELVCNQDVRCCGHHLLEGSHLRLSTASTLDRRGGGAVLCGAATARAPGERRHGEMGNVQIGAGSGCGAAPTFSRRRALRGLAGTALALAGATGPSAGRPSA